MKRVWMFWSLFIIGLLASSVLAGEDSQQGADNQYPTLAPQVRCPVMGGIIDSAYFTDIQGQRVYHCCGGCSDKLTADPDTFFKKAAAQGVLFQNIQTKCPVNGKAIDKTLFVDYEGRRIYFNKEKCMEKFEKDPVKYLAELDKQSRNQEHDDKSNEHDSHDSGRSGHGGHGGGCGM